MDRTMLAKHLEQASRHVAEGERHIGRQEALIAELDRDGHDTMDARAILDTLRASQRLHKQDVERILRELQQ